MKPIQHFPETHLEAVRYFADPDNCHDFLVAIRWPDGVRCPHCESDRVGRLVISGKRRLWNCKSCRRQFTAKVRTIFEDSPLGLDKWLPAIWMIVNAKNGISSCELARALGVSQKTAWHMGHRVRAAMHEGIGGLCGGVEADESFIGGKARNMHKRRKEAVMRGAQNTALTAVAGLLERTTDGKHSRVKLTIVKTTKRGELQDNVRANVGKGASVFTDALLSYEGLSDEYVHQVIDHAIAYVDGAIHTNGRSRAPMLKSSRSTCFDI
jgi:transposase-like protein